jgi:plastocyanin
MKVDPMSVRWFACWLPILGVAGALACGGGSGGSGPPPLTIQKAATASGDGQTDTVLTTLANPLRVVVSLGTPKSGETVTWAAAGSGSSVTPLTSVTDMNGVAATMWKLGHTSGAQTATATLSGATGSPLTFNATATPGMPTQMISPTGGGQSSMVGTVLPQPLAVKVADQYGNGVSGIAIAWQVTSGSATPSPTNPTSTATGVAQTTVTLGGTPGGITITATNASLAGSPQSFNVTADPIPTTAAVTVGPGIVFTSDRNNSANAAVDTIAVGGTVTWTWATGAILHSVQSTGSPTFTNSSSQTAGTYSFTFNSAGTYTYDCIQHGTGMNGRIVVR